MSTSETPNRGRAAPHLKVSPGKHLANAHEGHLVESGERNSIDCRRMRMLGCMHVPSSTRYVMECVPGHKEQRY